MAGFDISILSRLEIDPRTSAQEINNVINSSSFRNQLSEVRVSLTASDDLSEINSQIDKINSGSGLNSIRVGVTVNQKELQDEVNKAIKNIKVDNIKVGVDVDQPDKQRGTQPSTPTPTPTRDHALGVEKGITQEKREQNAVQKQSNQTQRESVNIADQIRNALSSTGAEVKSLERGYANVDAFVDDVVQSLRQQGNVLDHSVQDVTQLQNGFKQVTIQAQRYNDELRKTQTHSIKANLGQSGQVVPQSYSINDQASSQAARSKRDAIRLLDQEIKRNNDLVASGSRVEKSLRAQNSEYSRLRNAKDLSAKTTKELIDGNRRQVRAADQAAKARQMQIKLENDYAKAMQQNARFIDKTGMKQLQQQIKGVNTSATNALPQLNSMQQQMRGYVNQAAQATRSQMGLIENFNNAMVKFPVWMGASTLFFGATRAARDFVTTIVEIDSKMITLQKVMSDSANMDEVFNDASVAAERFGQTLGGVLDAYAEFARQGYEGVDLTNFGNAALIASNVGEISAQEASEFLTAASAQWQEGSEAAMGQVDSWNEIANNYATTVEKLGEGHAKAGATAKAMGLDFDETNAVIGALTAQTKQSGSEIGNFIKSAFPRMYAGAGRGVFEDLGIQMEAANGETKSAITLLREASIAMEDLSQADQADAIRGLGGVWHYQRMQVLLETLRDANGMYDQMLDSSRNAEGSAAAENAIYMESLEARINKAKVAIEEFGLALGEAFLEAGILEFLTVFTDGLTQLTKVFTDLSPIARNLGFGVFIAALASMSKGVRGLYSNLGNLPKALVNVQKAARDTARATNAINISTAVPTATPNTSVIAASPAMRQATQSMDQRLNSTLALTNAQKNLDKATQVSRSSQQAFIASNTALGSSTKTAATVTGGQVLQTQALSKAQTVAIGTSRALGAAFKGMLVATGVGAAIAAVTWGIEKFINKSADATNAANEFEQTISVLKQSMEADAEGVQSLADDFKELDETISSGDYSTEDMEEYSDVTSQLANLFPDLVAGVEEHGVALANQHGIIQSRIDLVNQQIEAEENLALVQAEAARQDIIDAGRSAEGDYNSQVGGLRDRYGYRDYVTGIGAGSGGGDERVFANAFQQELQMIAAAKDHNDVLEARNAIKERSSQIQIDNPEMYERIKAQIEELTTDLDNTNLSLQESYSQMIQGLSASGEAFLGSVMNITDASSEMGSATAGMFGNLANQISALGMTSEETESAFNGMLGMLQHDTGFVEKMGTYEAAVESFNNAATNEEKYAAMQEMQSAFENMAESIRSSLESLDVPEGQIETVIANLNDQIATAYGLDGAFQDTTSTIDDMIAAENAMAEAMGDGTGEIDDQSGAVLDLKYSWQEATAEMQSFTNEMRALEGELSTISAAMEELTETGSIDTSTFYDLLDLYPELLGMQLTEAELLDFLSEKSTERYNIQNELYNAQLEDNAQVQQGIIDNEDITTMAQAQNYATSAENFGKMSEYKQDMDALEKSTRDGNEAEVVNTIADKYGIDLTNFGDLASKKLEVERQLMALVADEWNTYIDQASAAATGIGAELGGMMPDFSGYKIGVGGSGSLGFNASAGINVPGLNKIGATSSLGFKDGASVGLPDFVQNTKDTDAFTNSLDNNRKSLDDLGRSGVGSGKSLDDFARGARGAGKAGDKAGKGAGKAGKGAAGAAKGVSEAAKKAEEAKEKIKDLNVEVETLTKTFEKQNFVLNQHEERLRKINLQIEKQNLQTERYATHSANYRRALQKENKLNREKLKAMQAQEKSLENQIKRGRINEYGMVSEDLNVLYNQYNTTSSGSGSKTRKTGTVTPAAASTSGGGSKTIAPFAGWKVNFQYEPQGGGRYGRQIGFNGGRHYGIDFGGRSGQTIRTPHGGTVVRSGWSNYGGGNQVEIYNKALDKTFTFMHMLGNLPLKAGQKVQAGTAVGRMGSTGNSTGTHLHFQVNSGRGINNARSVNPNKYLSSSSKGSFVNAVQSAATGTTATPSQLGNKISEETASYLNSVEQARLDAVENAVNKHNAKEENKSAVQQARENLDEMVLERLQLMAQIREIEFKMIESQIEHYEVEKNKLNHKIAQLEYKADNRARLKGQTSDSAEWRKWMNKARTEREKQLRFQQEQIKYIEGVLTADSRKSRSNRMNEAYRFQLEETLRSAKEEVINLHRAIDDAERDILASRVNQSMKEIDDALEAVDKQLTLIEHRRHFLDSTYGDGAKDYVKNLQQEIKQHQKREKTLNKSIRTLKNLRSNLRQQPELYEQVNDKIKEFEEGLRDVRRSVYDLNKEIKSLEIDKAFERLNKQLEKSQKLFNQIQNDLHFIDNEMQPDLYFDTQADSLKEMEKYRKTIEKNIKELKAMEKQVKEFPELHKQVTDEIKNWEDQYKTANQEMHTLRQEFAKSFIDSIKKIYGVQRDEALKTIDEELKEYEKMINKKLDLIDKQADEEQYDRDIKDRQETLQELRDEIAQRMGDDSLQNQRRLKELREELADAEDEYNQFIENKQRERRKEALQEELADAQEAAEGQRENTNDLYDDLLNDQRAFNEMQEQIMQGQVDKYKGVYQQLTDFVSESSKEIGRSISEGLIDGITTPYEALVKLTDLLKSIEGDGVPVPESGLRPSSPAVDKVITDLMQGVSNNTTMSKLGLLPSIPDIGGNSDKPSTTNNHNNNINSLLNIENYRGTQKEQDQLLNALVSEFRKLGMKV